MPEPVATTLEAVLKQFRTELVTANLYADDAVFYSLDAEAPPPSPPGGDGYCVLTPGPFEQDVALENNYDSTYALMNGTITTSLWVRLAVDEAGRDTLWLTGTEAALVQLRRVVARLQFLWMTDPDGNYLTYEKLDLVRMSPRARPTPQGWGRMEADWRVRWVLDLSGG